MKIQQYGKVYSEEEITLFKILNSPKKIQDFLNSLKFNFEQGGETCMSPRLVIRNKKAHCMEGAMFAAAVLEFHGYKPLVLDLRSVKPGDDDHIVALFKQFDCWGALSKTNHGVLRYREPIYKTVRELAMSYFHEYFLNNGKKTLREYSKVFNLRFFDKYPSLILPAHGGGSAVSLPPGGGGLGRGGNWRTSGKDLFEIPQYLDKIKHYKILSSAQIKNLRKADGIEIKVGKIVDWKNKYK